MEFKPHDCSLHSTSSEAGFALRSDLFGKILERERMRADRCEKPFSVLVFTGDTTSATTRPEFSELIRTLQGRLRTTDVVGYLDRQRLATLLFDTDRSGARTVLDSIGQDGLSEVRQHISSVHTYPIEPPDDLPATTDAPRQEMLFIRPMPRWKRMADIFLASGSLIVFAPIMAAAALTIKLTSPGPILFLQRRVGLAGRPFFVYKFRTMCEDAAEQQDELRPHSEQDGPAFKLKHDPRVTWVGKYLRKTCIDESPNSGTCSAVRCRSSGLVRSPWTNPLIAAAGSVDAWMSRRA